MTSTADNGKTAAEHLDAETDKEEARTEEAKGSELKKGKDRVTERARAANGSGPRAD